MSKPIRVYVAYKSNSLNVNSIYYEKKNPKNSHSSEYKI